MNCQDAPVFLTTQSLVVASKSQANSRELIDSFVAVVGMLLGNRLSGAPGIGLLVVRSVVIVRLVVGVLLVVVVILVGYGLLVVVVLLVGYVLLVVVVILVGLLVGLN